MGGIITSTSLLIVGLLALSISPASWSNVIIPIDQIPSEIAQGNPVAVITLGILILIATPLMRILTALFVFVLERDLKYAGISSFILIIVAIAVIIGVT